MNAEQDCALEQVRDTCAVLRTFTDAENMGGSHVGLVRHLPAAHEAIPSQVHRATWQGHRRNTSPPFPYPDRPHGPRTDINERPCGVLRSANTDPGVPPARSGLPRVVSRFRWLSCGCRRHRPRLPVSPSRRHTTGRGCPLTLTIKATELRGPPTAGTLARFVTRVPSQSVDERCRDVVYVADFGHRSLGITRSGTRDPKGAGTVEPWRFVGGRPSPSGPL